MAGLTTIVPEILHFAKSSYMFVLLTCNESINYKCLKFHFRQNRLIWEMMA